jgi:two-component system sensor histidine kinase RegB
VAAVVVTVFVSRARRALAEHELVQAELRASDDRQSRLAALATLAGGAAHELATPLGTIAIAASELDKRLQASTDASVREDAALILSEVRRCKKILEHLAAHGGEAMGEAPARTTLTELVRLALEDVPGASDVRIEGPTDVAAVVPPIATATALRGILRNARQASTDVQVTVRASPPSLSVEDRGPGMKPDVLGRVGEPFFTTRDPGRGMGLGVFLARTLAERLGGSLEISSALERGTRVTWVFRSEAT